VHGYNRMELKKRPQNPTVITGFPGFGLVGSIATEFLIEHCNCEMIGAQFFEKMPATIAVHEGKIINPVNIYYSSDKNMVVVHGISGGQGMEWEYADFVLQLAGELQAKEIISLEGVGSVNQENTKVFSIVSDQSRKEHMKSIGADELREGIIVGVTSALLMKSKVPILALFAETHSELPDSKASAHIIELLNKYMSLNIDTKPLLEQAQKFEDKLNRILKQGSDAQDQIKKKQLSYVG
jgi:uncharacterized protein